MSITGFQGQGPVRAGIAVADSTTGLFSAIGILTALLEREQSGRTVYRVRVKSKPEDIVIERVLVAEGQPVAAGAELVRLSEGGQPVEGEVGIGGSLGRGEFLLADGLLERLHGKDLPLVRLDRPGWGGHPLANTWVWVDDHETAAEAAAGRGRALLTVGRQPLHHYLDLPDAAEPSDNYFNLAPGREKAVRVTGARQSEVRVGALNGVDAVITH